MNIFCHISFRTPFWGDIPMESNVTKKRRILFSLQNLKKMKFFLSFLPILEISIPFTHPFLHWQSAVWFVMPYKWSIYEALCGGESSSIFVCVIFRNGYAKRWKFRRSLHFISKGERVVKKYWCIQSTWFLWEPWNILSNMRLNNL